MSQEKKSSIDTLYEQTQLIAKQVEELKREVMGEKTYSFTKTQLKEFSERLFDNFKDYYSSEISNIDFDSESIELELVDNVIVATFDSSVITDEIDESVDSPTEKEMENMVKEILEGMEIELK